MNQPLNERDETYLAQHNITSEEVNRQISMLLEEKCGVELSRPCSLGDGIQTISDEELPELLAAFETSAGSGRWLKFVPASGAASRMFDLKEQAEQQRLCSNLTGFAFFEDLASACQTAGQDLTDLSNRNAHAKIVTALLDKPGLNYSSLPKGLLKFHRYANTNRTPFEEHLREAARCFRDSNGRCRAHFTVSDDDEWIFNSLLEELRPVIKEQLVADLEVSFSVQKPSTNTLALDPNEVLRDEQGNPVLRPAGHGALIENLRDLERADLVFIKNIDNICHERMSDPTHTWIRALGGYLVRLQAELSASSNGVDCPIRICGMVRNEGEPGGGPFWVREPDGSESLQIVESAEVNKKSDEQQKIFTQATHFNPVFMVLAIRDQNGELHELHDFVNQDRFIFTRKVEKGRSVRALERPGLWNGTMHFWHTVFVEVPKDVFSPVKTVFDLLRAEHQESPS
ncbi:MAG: DUF4301 family protein [Planctomycetes bacterium]|nr:DUF4301 family protein [Planctomycetota bacterium]